jgi:hypothetical protein
MDQKRIEEVKNIIPDIIVETLILKVLVKFLTYDWLDSVRTGFRL